MILYGGNYYLLQIENMYLLWFKFSFGAKFLKLVQFLFSFSSFIHYHNLEQWQIKFEPLKKTFNQG